MKRGTKLLILLLVCAVFVVAAVFVTRMKGSEEDPAETSTTEGFALLDRSIGEIKYMKWENTESEEIFAFENLGDIWSYTPIPAYTVDSDFMNTFASLFCPLTVFREIEDTSDLSAFGLDHPSAVIEVTFTDESVCSVTVGNITSIAGRCYIAVDGHVYTATSNLSAYSKKTLDNFAVPTAE